MTADRTAIDERRRQWIDAVNAGSVEEYVDLLTEDVVWFPPGEAALHGREAFEDWVAPFMARYEYEFAIEGPEVTMAGGWAVERGQFETTLVSREEGETMSHSGTYLVLWRRDANDRWSIERYVDASQIP